MRFLVLLAAAVLVLGLNPARAQEAERRLALVIGNSAYRTPGWQLANPQRDAAEMAVRLKRLGFEVDSVSDATKADMEAAFDRFGTALKSAGEGAIGFFYYAGHAAQNDGVNFLIPVDANASTMDRLRYQAPPLQFLLDDMAEAKNAVNILVLDACRNVPLPEGSRSISGRGLADLGRKPNFFVAYATTPGATAADGDGSNSPFTTALVTALDRRPSDPVELLFSDVNNRVYIATDGGQAPEYRNGLVRAPRWSLARDTPAGGLAATNGRQFRRTPEFLKSLDRDRLLAFTRGTRETTPFGEVFVNVILARRDILMDNDITTPLRLSHFLGQVAVETGGFRFLNDNLNYSAERLRIIWPTRFPTLESAQLVARDPQKIGNLVYAGKLGNGPPESGDGYRYRSRGFFPMFGRNAYQSYGELMGLPLAADPDLASDPEVALGIAALYWSSKGANERADADDALAVSRIVNLGTASSARTPSNYSNRVESLNAAKALFGLPASSLPSVEDGPLR